MQTLAPACHSYSANLIISFNTQNLWGRKYLITDKKLHNLPKVKHLEIGRISNWSHAFFNSNSKPILLLFFSLSFFKLFEIYLRIYIIYKEKFIKPRCSAKLFFTKCTPGDHQPGKEIERCQYAKCAPKSSPNLSLALFPKSKPFL